MIGSRLYTATFNKGEIEETFFAVDEVHASEVAHEIAARRRLTFDAVQPTAPAVTMACGPEGCSRP